MTELTKCIVKPITSINLYDLYTGELVVHNRPTVVTKTPFIDIQLYDKNIKFLAIGLPMEASDKEFSELFYDSGKDEKLAVDSYCALFGIDKDGNKIEVEE